MSSDDEQDSIAFSFSSVRGDRDEIDVFPRTAVVQKASRKTLEITFTIIITTDFCFGMTMCNQSHTGISKSN